MSSLRKNREYGNIKKVGWVKPNFRKTKRPDFSGCKITVRKRRKNKDFENTKK